MRKPYTTTKILALISAIVLALAAITAARAQQSQATPASVQSSDEPIVLSPFDVNASTDVGYGATGTATTSRAMQSYIDVPQSVSVVTSEFITDFNLQNERQALLYIPNYEFSEPESGHVNIRGIAVGINYVDGVAASEFHNAMPMEFFDRIEVVRGPSSAAFGLGSPGGIINFVSKVPQGIEATTASIGVGIFNNFFARFDTQGVSRANDKLSYRLIGFYNKGGEGKPNYFHNGTGFQLSTNYDMNSTTKISLITAYSATATPFGEQNANIIRSYGAYSVLQSVEVGNPVWTSLPGTQFSNGSVFGVSGTLPAAGSPGAVGIYGTGKLLGADAQPGPPGWNADSENDFRTTLIINKDLDDKHISVRNALTLEFSNNDTRDQTESLVQSLPGSNNPGVVGGFPDAPVSISPSDTGSVINPAVGPAQYFFGYYRLLRDGTQSNRQDEIDINADYDFFGVHSQTLVGGDAYNNENTASEYNIPNINVDGSQEYVNVYATNNKPLYVPPASTWVHTDDSNYHTFGYGYYGQEIVSMFHDVLTAMAGWRIDYYDEHQRLYLNNQNLVPGWVNTKGAPRYAVTIKPVSWLSVYGLYTDHNDPAQQTHKYFLASGSEAIPGYDLAEIESYNPGGYSVEFGTKAVLFGGKVYFSADVFHEITSGAIQGIPVARATNPDGSNSQIGENQVVGFNNHGVEFEAFGQATPRLNFTAAYSFTHGYGPEYAPGFPNFVDTPAEFSLHGKYDFGDLRGHGLYVTFGTLWYGPHYLWGGASAANYVYSHDWEKEFDAGVGYRWKNGKYRQSIYLNVDNLMNAIVSTGSSTNLPWGDLPERAAFLSYTVSY